MLIVDLLLFGAIGATVWAVQMLWIPITAAGIINGIGHWWGYRNFEAPDASTNVSPWGIIIGGEELHNNHHTYPTSAKLSVKPYEFDIGWVYIRGLEMLGLAKVRKTPPQLTLGSDQAGGRRQDARGDHRQPLRGDGQVRGARLRRAVGAELDRLKAQGAQNTSRWKDMRLAKRWLHRDDDKIPQGIKPQLAQALGESPKLAKLVAMREELRRLWTRTNVSAEQLVVDLQAWCRKAEEQRHRRAAGVLAEAACGARVTPAVRSVNANGRLERPRFSNGPDRLRDPPITITSASFPCTGTCLRAFGSNFMNSSFSGVVFLFLSVV